ncbi:MAG: ABC transporter permease, partial [Oscillospiraceae bacterium]|nr:ABC transporter permease [Oscillospiraceae bacterium]
MTSFGAYLGSVQQSIIRYISDEDGAYEVNVSNLLKDSPKENARDILKNHAVVKNYCIYGAASGFDYVTNRFQRDEDGWFDDLTLQLDNGYTTHLHQVHQSYFSGDSYLAEGKRGTYSKELPEGSIIVPKWMHDLGYEIGDTVTFTLTIGSAQLDPESDQIPEAVRLIESMDAENGNTICYIKDGQEYPIDQERHGQFKEYTMMQLIGYSHDLDDIDIINETVDGSVTFTATIADFLNDVWTDSKTVNAAKHTFAFETSDSFGNLLDPAVFRYGRAYESAYIEVMDNIEFETALMELLLDMGFDKTKYYDYYTDDVLHTDLLGAKLKGADAISFAFYGIMILLVLLLVVWLVARFIIDNAFEISVQERSRQFAALRIMGASRNQLFGLVLTEAVFYCLTAVPLGTILAVLCCRLVMNSFAYAGLNMFIFYIHPLALFLSVFLAVAGVMISAYTSAMWAARKLSPLEALQ